MMLLSGQGKRLLRRLEEIEKQQAQAPAEDISSQNLSTEQLFAMGGQLT